MTAARRRRLAAFLPLLPFLAGCPFVGIDPNSFRSCDDLQGRGEVQNALALLASGGQNFTFFDGSSPADLTGIWDITASVVTYTDAGPDNTVLPVGRMTFTPQGASGVLAWSALQGDARGDSIRSFYSGNAAGMTVCLFSEMRVVDNRGLTTCSTQNAMFFSLLPNAGGDSFSGNFLSVVLATLSGGSPCGSAGSFSFGTISLKRVNPDIPIIEPIGSIALGTATPASVGLTPGGTIGYVGFATGAVLRFETDTLKSAFLTLPNPNNFTTVSNVHIAPNGGLVGFTMQGDNRVLAYNTTGTNVLEAHILPPQLPSPALFINQPPLFNSVATAGFVGLNFQNHRPALALFNPHAGPNSTGINAFASFQQDGLGLLRMSPSTAQVAAVLNGGAPGGLARFVGFVNVSGQSPQFTREVDVSSATFQTFRDNQLVYGSDSNRVFVANDVNLFSIAANGNFAVNTLDPRDDGSDVVRHLAVSDDNEVLAVTVAAGAGRSNWVLLSPASLAPVHRANQAGAAVSIGGGSLAFVPGSRIAVVEDGAGSVTPINSRAPFASGGTLRAAASNAAVDCLPVAVGDRVIAVVNRTERTLYLFRLVNP